ncbi:MAG: type II toxin-antitoxin system prevent-host-death family antitoxin [Actinobacteria bacterium]|nr:type II toxin-antitoxin system prevent-host-death family antitoxin [Actinomycetota bacterium]
MVLLHDSRVVSVTDATRRGVSGLVCDAEHGEDIVVARHSKPVAAVVSMRRFSELQALEEDLRDLVVVLARVATDSGRRTSLDDVLAAFETNRAELEALDDH